MQEPSRSKPAASAALSLCYASADLSGPDRSSGSVWRDRLPSPALAERVMPFVWKHHPTFAGRDVVCKHRQELGVALLNGPRTLKCGGAKCAVATPVSGRAHRRVPHEELAQSQLSSGLEVVGARLALIASSNPGQTQADVSSYAPDHQQLRAFRLTPEEPHPKSSPEVSPFDPGGAEAVPVSVPAATISAWPTAPLAAVPDNLGSAADSRRTAPLV